MNFGCTDMIQGAFGLCRRVGLGSLLVVMGLVGWGQGVGRSVVGTSALKDRVAGRKLVLPAKGMCPLRGGVVVVDTAGPPRYGRPNAGIEIEATDSLVLSPIAGEVQAMFSVGDVKAVMIRTKDSLFYTYSNLDSVFVTKRQAIRAGQVIGYKTTEMPLEFVITNRRGTNLPALKRVDCKVEYRKRANRNTLYIARI